MKFINVILIIAVMLTPTLATASHAMMIGMGTAHCPEVNTPHDMDEHRKMPNQHNHASMQIGSGQAAIDFCCMEACCPAQALILNHQIPTINSQMVIFSHYTQVYSPRAPEVISPPPKV